MRRESKVEIKKTFCYFILKIFIQILNILFDAIKENMDISKYSKIKLFKKIYKSIDLERK